MVKFLSTTEKQSLFRQIYNETGIHRKRNIAIFEVALYCGLRVSEIALLQLDDYDSSTHTIHCHRLKNSNSNSLKIVDLHVIKALEEYLEERAQISTSCSAIFLSQKGNPISRQRLDAMMKQYCKDTNISPTKRHMHILKHTRAIDLAEKHCDVDDIQYWIGHKNIKNTLIYLEYTTALKNQLFDKLSELEGGTYNGRFD